VNSARGSVLIILVLILGILLGVAGFFAYQEFYRKPAPSPSPTSTNQFESNTPSSIDETANWKTYENQKVGFSIKYPPRYESPTLPSGMGDSPTIYATGQEDTNTIIFGTTSTDSFSLTFFPFNGSLKELRQQRQISFPPYTWEETDNISAITNEITVGGQKAELVTARHKNVSYNTQTYRAIFFINKNHGFVLNPSPDHDEKEINLILSTFKFLE